MASLSSGLRPTDSFITSTLQKFLFREMKLLDLAIKNPDALKWNPVNKRYAPTSTGKKSADVQDEPDEDSDGGPEDTAVSASSPEKLALPTRNNPLVVAIYGQMCVAAKSYQSAICKNFLSCMCIFTYSKSKFTCYTLMTIVPTIPWFAFRLQLHPSAGQCNDSLTIDIT